MERLHKVLAVLAGVFIMWILYGYIRSNPESLSRENLSKSFFSIGMLALGLIVFIGFVVILLRR